MAWKIFIDHRGEWQWDHHDTETGLVTSSARGHRTRDQCMRDAIAHGWSGEEEQEAPTRPIDETR